MNKPHYSLSVSECKIQASILLKALYSDDPTIAKRAAKRFARFPDFAKLSFDEIIQMEIKRKSALAVIAIEKGFRSWADLKCQLPFIMGGFLNKWFVNYAEAKSHLTAEGGFLLPYKNQFFICEAGYIAQLGLDPHDQDWKSIGFDWVNPIDQAAWRRLYKKWMDIQARDNE